MFAVGTYVTGENFIGREVELRKLANYIKDNQNITVTGLPRIGKTSLVKEAIRRFKSQDNGVCPLFFEFALTRNPEDKIVFYQALDDILETQIPDKNSSLFSDFSRLRSRNRKSYLLYTNLYRKIYNITGKSLYIVIDELDYAHESLRGEIQNLREMVSQTDVIRLIAISRHRLITLFPLGNDGSNFPGIFSSSINLKGFCPKDIDLFRSIAFSHFQKIRPIDQCIWDDLWKTVHYYCGNIPILLSIFISKMIDDIDSYPYFNIKSIISKSSQYYSCLYYWFQSICERKLMDEINCCIASNYEDLGTGDLVAWGIVEDKQFTIPYLVEFLQQICRLDDNNLVSEYCSISVDIKPLVERAGGIARDLQGTDNSTFRELQKGIEELNAICLKNDYIKKLKDLHSELVAPDVSLEELNLFKEYIRRFSTRLESLDK